MSATTTIEELDKKVGKTSIVTSISSTSTDDTVPSAKAVYDNVIKDNNLNLISRPKVDVKTLEIGKDFEFEITFELYPEVPEIKYNKIYN